MSLSDMAPPYATGSYGVTHTDSGLLQYFADQGFRSMLDVGCGPGGQVQMALAAGWRALGIDVDPALYRLPGVALIDLCVQPVTLPTRADLVWSVEVAEHIPLEHVQAYVRTLTSNADLAIVLTASQEATPHHVTVRPVSWWIAQVQASGEFVLASDCREVIARRSTMAREFLRETGMIFWRRQ